MKKTLFTIAALLLSVQLAFAVVIADNFNRANANPIDGSWAGGYTGANAVELTGNALRSTAVSNDGALASHTTALANDQWSKAVIKTMTGAILLGLSVGVRQAAPTTDSGYFCQAVQSGVTRTTEMYKFVAAAFTSIATENATTWVPTDSIMATVSGDNLGCYRNEAILLTGTGGSSHASGRAAIRIYVETLGNLADAEMDDFQAGDLISFVNAGTEGSAANGNCTPGTPASPANDDIWIAAMHVSDQVAVTMDAAWTQIAQGNGGGTTSRLAAFWFRYAGSTPTMTMTHSGGQSPICGVATFRGAKTSGSPINAVGTILGGTDGSMETNTVTPTLGATMVLAIAGSADDNNHTAIANYAIALEDSGAGTNGAFVTTAGTPDGSVGLQYIQHTSGATNPTITQAASDPWTTLMVALERAVASLADAATCGGGLMMMGVGC